MLSVASTHVSGCSPFTTRTRRLKWRETQRITKCLNSGTHQDQSDDGRLRKHQCRGCHAHELFLFLMVPPSCEEIALDPSVIAKLVSELAARCPKTYGGFCPRVLSYYLVFVLCLWAQIMFSRSRSCGANRRAVVRSSMTAGGTNTSFDMRWIPFCARFCLMFQDCPSNKSI